MEEKKKPFHREHKVEIEDYLKRLLSEIGNLKTQLLDSIGAHLQDKNSPISVNGTELSQQDILKACLEIMTKEPTYFFWHWEFLCSEDEDSVKQVFLILENYLRSLPGAVLPGKDPLIEKWMESPPKISE